MSRRSVIVARIGVFIALVGVVCSGALSALMDTGAEGLGVFGLFSSVLAIPLALAMLWLSTALTGDHHQRMWVFGVSLPISLVGGVLMAVGMGAETTVVNGLVAGVLFYGLPIALTAAGLVYNAAIAIPAGREAAHRDALDRTTAFVIDRGHRRFADVAQALSVHDDEAVSLLAEVRRTGRAPLELDLHARRVWSQDWANDQCRRLQLRLKNDGRVTLQQFADTRDVPVEMVREWVYTLVYRRKLSGYVSWNEGVLYSAKAEVLRGSSRCPSCAGQLELVTSGVVQCQHCDTQTLLA